MKTREILGTTILVALTLTIVFTAIGFAQTQGKVVNKIDDLVGIWESQFQGNIAYMQFNADGTLKLAATIEVLKSDVGLAYTGNFWFEGNVYGMTETAGSDTGTYTIRMQKEGNIAKLFFTPVDEPNPNRKAALTKGMTRVEP